MAARREGDTECCMCGDYGLSSELFRCKGCQFRSQHRYCSNIYPDADSYGICNWCLNQKDETAGGKEQKTWNSSESCKIKGKDYVKIKKKKTLEDIHREKPGKLIIKKQKSLDSSPLSGARKRITTGDKISPRLRRTRSEGIINGGIKKHVFRNKVVRRYKHLDEVPIC
ncbi:Uncharacterized protein Adt_14891 [Abeliophyllum distichum]|uniref:PHD-type zinc finger plants domain-containing protein n=1 Tax=Abeliophyllum distichum TaxID=126358 RepID=A0ABD1Q0Y8_9LAMI